MHDSSPQMWMTSLGNLPHQHCTMLQQGILKRVNWFAPPARQLTSRANLWASTWSSSNALSNCSSSKCHYGLFACHYGLFKCHYGLFKGHHSLFNRQLRPFTKSFRTNRKGQFKIKFPGKLEAMRRKSMTLPSPSQLLDIWAGSAENDVDLSAGALLRFDVQITTKLLRQKSAQRQANAIPCQHHAVGLTTPG